MLAVVWYQNPRWGTYCCERMVFCSQDSW